MTYIPVVLRREVIARARNCCEYCLLNVNDHVFPFEIDHITSEKHLGLTESENLCLSCYDCNNAKGSDVAAADPLTKLATFLFHPRKQRWKDHFRLHGAGIEPLTPEGRVTVFLLKLNDAERVIDRAGLIRLERYPCELI
ncbi:MAG: HNH endonuclease signature motif containing protein [Chloroflexota bacterium]|nr:HNH endonuclease signature motif containing protein [Chloroflexota bacterium]